MFFFFFFLSSQRDHRFLNYYVEVKVSLAKKKLNALLLNDCVMFLLKQIFRLE